LYNFAAVYQLSTCAYIVVIRQSNPVTTLSHSVCVKKSIRARSVGARCVPTHLQAHRCCRPAACQPSQPSGAVCPAYSGHPAGTLFIRNCCSGRFYFATKSPSWSYDDRRKRRV